MYYLKRTLVWTPSQQMPILKAVKMHLVKHCLSKVESSYVCPKCPNRNRFTFSTQCVYAMPLRLPNARQPYWSYSDSYFAKFTTSSCKKSVYLWKAEYRVSQHKVNCLSKDVY